MSEMLLHLPASLRSLRDLPFLGHLIHYVSHRIIPQDQRVWARIERGPAQDLWLELNPRTGQSYVHGQVEVTVQNSLADRLRPGMVFYDLGANIGLFTLLAARLIGETGKVFSFEPDPENAARLRRNVERNCFSNVTIVEAGVWSTSRNLIFLAADEQSPDRGVGMFIAQNDASRGIPICCVSLDDFVRNAPPPDALKCDVEGAEFEALRGGEKMLQVKHPWIICEMHSEANNRSLRQFLSSLGYTLETLDGYHILASP